MDTETTVVVFRRWPKAEGGDVLALFPAVAHDYHGTLCGSYQHVGQHGGADYMRCIQGTKPAFLNEPDVAALKAELESIGYRLRVAQRCTPRMWRQRIAG